MTTTKATQWSITINNPTDEDHLNITQAQQKGWKITGQQEEGDNQTPHLQLMVKTPHIRFSAMKKQFPRAHIEIARNPIALQQYVVKEETRTGQLPNKNNQALYPNIEELYRRYAQRYMAKYHDERLDENGNTPLTDMLEKMHEEEALRQWKRFLATQVREGNHVDQLAVNPQIVSFVKQYHTSIVLRALDQIVDKTLEDIQRQTDNALNQDQQDTTDITNDN